MLWGPPVGPAHWFRKAALYALGLYCRMPLAPKDPGSLCANGFVWNWICLEIYPKEQYQL